MHNYAPCDIIDIEDKRKGEVTMNMNLEAIPLNWVISDEKERQEFVEEMFIEEGDFAGYNTENVLLFPNRFEDRMSASAVFLHTLIGNYKDTFKSRDVDNWDFVVALDKIAGSLEKTMNSASIKDREVKRWDVIDLKSSLENAVATLDLILKRDKVDQR